MAGLFLQGDTHILKKRENFIQKYFWLFLDDQVTGIRNRVKT